MAFETRLEKYDTIPTLQFIYSDLVSSWLEDVSSYSPPILSAFDFHLPTPPNKKIQNMISSRMSIVSSNRSLKCPVIWIFIQTYPLFYNRGLSFQF